MRSSNVPSFNVQFFNAQSFVQSRATGDLSNNLNELSRS